MSSMSVGTCVESISRTAEHSIGMSSIHMTLLEEEEELKLAHADPELEEAELELLQLEELEPLLGQIPAQSTAQGQSEL
jgi:hypothetical protein